ncbi:MAG: hypothetical protein PHT88_05440 [Candidatus Moranbacteria bacterium]|nr:hypothetical protein [Candidatus Moranbacteria bacterium]
MITFTLYVAGFGEMTLQVVDVINDITFHENYRRSNPEMIKLVIDILSEKKGPVTIVPAEGTLSNDCWYIAIKSIIDLHNMRFNVGTSAEYLEEDQQFIRFPKLGQTSCSLFKYKSRCTFLEGRENPVVIAFDLHSMKEEIIAMNTHILIIRN